VVGRRQRARKPLFQVFDRRLACLGVDILFKSVKTIALTISTKSVLIFLDRSALYL
jgi:hypothetical protein